MLLWKQNRIQQSNNMQRTKEFLEIMTAEMKNSVERMKDIVESPIKNRKKKIKGLC